MERVIWEDRDGDRLIADLDGWTMTREDMGPCDSVYFPTDHDDKVAVAAAFVDALELECDGFRAKPEPPKLDQWVHRNLMPHITTHRRYNALTTEEVVAEAFRVATTDPAAFAEFVTFLPLLSFTPAEEVEQGEVEQSEGECEWHSSDPEVCCDTSDPNTGFVCTRPAGHAGLHIACGVKEGDLHDLARWSA